MSRPRKPFGASHPGRLPATMMKVLAAEMSDPSRLRRGKQYAKDGSVIDIIIEPFTVTCEIQGSRSTPYVATITVTPGNGMPLRRDITTACTCPDDDNWDGHACKHVVAAMFVFSDELLLEPELLDTWRGSDRAPRDTDDQDTDEDDRDEPRSGTAATSSPTTRPGRGHLRLVGAEERAPTPPRDRLADLLTTPSGATLPEIPRIAVAEPSDPDDGDLAAVLRDALSQLRLDWD